MSRQYPGMLIVFEGLNKCGKSTQVLLTEQKLYAMGYDVFTTKQPYDPGIRNLLLNGSNLSPMAELMLFSADRLEHVQKVIKPALAAGKVILCDRFYHSSIAYQSFAGGIPIDAVDDLIDMTIGNVEPDVTIWLDTDPITCYNRMLPPNTDRIEDKPLEYHQSAYQGYLAMYEEYEDIIRIDGNQSIQLIQDDIISYLRSIM